METEPTFTFSVPTHREDRPLKRCLDSLAPQLGPRDNVLVVGDTFDGDLPGVEALVREYGSQFRYIPYNAGRHTWGHDQINLAFDLATGDWLHVNDDDDIWLPDAVPTMRQFAIANPGRPLLFQFMAMDDRILWDKAGHVERNYIGGHCLVQPNIKGKIGKMGPIYSGDYDMIRECLDLHGGDASAVWIDKIICRARPH